MIWLLLLALAVSLSACAGTGTGVGAGVGTSAGGGTVAEGRLSTLIVGWERFFKLDWKVDMSKGRPLVWGYISNEYGLTAARIRLLVDALDASGNILYQQLAWVPFTLTPGTRSYFEVPMPQEAPTYRVSVFSFDWIDQSDFRRRWP